MSDIKKNDVVELEITAVSNLGYGVGRTEDGKVVFTPGTVTGERVEVKIIKITKGYLVGKLQRIILESPLLFSNLTGTHTPVNYDGTGRVTILAHPSLSL